MSFFCNFTFNKADKFEFLSEFLDKHDKYDDICLPFILNKIILIQIKFKMNPIL